MQLDVLIFGGGAAGLWLLDTLFWRGARALLLETGRLGSGQTVAAQGIIHGGLKYSLQGVLTPSALQIREMPEHWRECHIGRRQPDLRGMRLRSPHCYLWRTDSFASRLAMMGARVGLNVVPQLLHEDDRPAVLARCPGPAARLDEPVIAPDSLLETLFSKHRSRILKVDAADVVWDFDSRRNVRAVRLSHPSWGRQLALTPRHVVLTAGKGNADLRRQLGLADGAMQCRALHMVLARGRLPELNGHCVDGAATRVTITSDRASAGQTVWQIGGQIAEAGVSLDERTLIQRAKAEVEATIPGIELRGVEWSTYRVDRAEGATSGRTRPETVQVVQEGNVLTAWPTKLALAPVLAERVAESLAPFESNSAIDGAILEDWPRPEIARPPWETVRSWYTAAELDGPIRKAA
ncbi:MAG TPA: FAD-dependent oxidoreductase [Planctomycetaceae bacterium]|jgi:glycerol-3-phosphate dehydrogenase|nr:FAD-dependent oxidoreductase [Planctomycetaceae bacterium]